MRAIVPCFLCVGLLLGWIAAQAAPAKKPAPKSTKTTAAKKSPSKSTAKKSTAKSTARKSTTKSAKSTKRPARRRSTTARRVRRPAGQGKPSPERYAEIQRALKQRGYFEGETDGKWGDASTLALKQFQKDQNLKPDGKLGSLSLIALGLGPKRGSVQPASAPQSAPPPAPPAAVPTEGAPPTPNDKAAPRD